MASLGTSIRIFLVDGTPEGFRLVEKSNWSGQALVCARSQYPDKRKRTEFDGPGIYCLTGSADHNGKQRLYIGETDVLRDRLDQHSKTKEFWTGFVAFTSKDLTLNKAHIKHLESRLVGLASKAKTWALDNGNTPTAPSLAEADVADAEGFLEEMLLIYPILGIDAFEIPKGRDPSAKGDLVLGKGGASGHGRDDPEGFVVFEGALARPGTAKAMPDGYRALREDLVAAGVLVAEGNGFRLTQDYLFSSPSAAAAVLLGRAANGRTEWADESGRTLKEIQEAALA